MKARTLALAGLITAFYTGAAHAHFNLMSPPSSAKDTGGGKGKPPCGPDIMVGTTATKVQGGHALHIKLVEFVPHPGHYRFALSLNGHADFPVDPPVEAKNGSSVSAAVQPAVFPVLADGVFDHTTPQNGGTYETDLMIPNITCHSCGLQVIEFMAEHGANGLDPKNDPTYPGTYYYHHCADLDVTADPALPAGDGGAAPPSADGGAAPSADASSGGSADAATTGTGGTPASGGAGGSPTGGTGGTTATGGTTGSGGTTASGGTTGSGGTPAPHSSSGGCAVGGSTTSGAAFSLALALVALIARRRRR